MKWESWGKYAKKSKKYSICKVFIHDAPIYELWKLPNTFLGKYETYEQAKISALDFDRKEFATLNRDEIDETRLLKTMGSDYQRKRG